MKRSRALRCVLSLSCLLAACGGGGGGGGGAPEVPAAVDDAFAIVKGTTLLGDVLANDVGGDDPAATVSLVTPPAHGTASVDPDRRVRYDPDPGFEGADSLVYALHPAGGAPTSATLTVTAYRTLAAGAPAVFLPRTSITAREVGVVVNDLDAQSVDVAAYFVAARHVPAGNVVHLSFTPGGIDLSAAEFAPLKAAVDAALGPDVQVLVLTWTDPFRVQGMAITSAFALGWDVAYTVDVPCEETLACPYYSSGSTRPYTDHGVRPTMMLGGMTAADVHALIDRGVAADDTFPGGTAYLVRTTDVPRSVRWPAMEQAAADWDHAPEGLSVVYQDGHLGGPAETVVSTAGVLFYLTGFQGVPGIDTNTYVPGAVADHLTSFGGYLTVDTGQMSILRWLEAGCTASFGTVVEPCNYTEKFPEPGVLLDAYYRGATVIEAYWRSVAWPGEGIFVGEPLARPWGHAYLDYDAAHTLVIATTCLEPGVLYDVLAADSPAGPFEPVVTGISVPHHRLATITVPSATRAAYRLEAQ